MAFVKNMETGLNHYRIAIFSLLVVFLGLILAGLFTLFSSLQNFTLIMYSGFAALSLAIFLVFGVVIYKSAERSRQREENELRKLQYAGFSFEKKSEWILEKLSGFELLHGFDQSIQYALNGVYRNRKWTFFSFGYRLAPAHAKWHHVVFMTEINQMNPDKLKQAIPVNIPKSPFKTEYKNGILIVHAPKASAFFYDAMKILDSIAEIAEKTEQGL